ncbi:plasmalemma vesicle associated protein b isoform X2 [Neoarius graeffei]|uniref:plasmalemma vesicle associated protein b isoform X2 n=1 Tax=Neoarius graeffei TaxID=443677 RepID=UPI00298CAD4D|nr:plasmalemma vesicle associated protein b isoform X2 [Neoarius graeffei]
MYNNNYTRPKVALKAQDIRKSKGKSCGYYLRLIFFFSSLIQSLIIVSLVLFLVYGQPEKSTDEKRVEELEQSFNKFTIDNTKLQKEKANLTALLKTKTTEKGAADKKVVKLTAELDAAKGNNTKLVQALASCNTNKMVLTRNISPCPASSTTEHRTLQTILEQQMSLYEILKTNFSQTVQNLKHDLDSAIKDKNKNEMAMLKLKQEKNDLTSELQLYQKKCKEDFVMSLQGIQNVTTAFLTKIDNLFPDTFTFQLTCSKQQEQMQKIHANCTNLSRQIEDKFQNYLNSVGDKVSALQAQSSRLDVENRRLTSEIQKCNQDHAEEVEKCTKLLQEAQQVQDRKVEPLLVAQKKLMQENQILQARCLPKPPMPKPNGLQPHMTFGQQSRTGQMSIPASNTAVQTKPGSSQSPKVR